MKQLKSSAQQQVFKYIQTNWINSNVYIWVDVGKSVLDIGITIQNSDINIYLWTIKNTAEWFKQLENFIIQLIQLWIDENDIFFWTENTGIYGHDIMNYFDDRLPNTYILNSSLTCHARKYYAKSDFKSDDIDAVIIAVTLKDLDSKNLLESIKNPFQKNCGLWFVRRSLSNERNSLRILFRRLCVLRNQKSKLMTSINLTKERLFPEINWIFSIKHRSSSEAILLNNFSRNEILNMTKDEFIQKYKSLASKWQQNSRVLKKIENFYEKVQSRWFKSSCCSLDKLMGKDSDAYLLEEIKFKLKHYELTCKEMDSVSQKIAILLWILQWNGYFIPQFKWINNIEVWLVLGELWFDIYKINSKEFIWFVWWYPENYTSWWWHIVKPSQLSRKKWIIKKFVYVWMYWFQLHNPSFRLYKKLLSLYYGINPENHSLVSTKNRRKIETKCWEKLLKIIHDWYKNKSSFCESRFLENTIIPMIYKMKDDWIDTKSIKSVISDVYKWNIISSWNIYNLYHKI